MHTNARGLMAPLLVSLIFGCGARAVTTGPGPAPDAAGSGSDAGSPAVDVFTLGPDVGFPVFDVGRPVDVNVFPPDLGFPRDTGFRFDSGIDVGPSSRTSVIAGRRCSDSSMCATAAADLSCVSLSGGRICSGAAQCSQGTLAREEAQCGGRFSTCLVIDNFSAGAQTSLCTRACVPTATSEAAGACPSGSICTTNWLQLMAGQTEVAGCLPFCARDADCAGIAGETGPRERCNVRTGRCEGAPSDPSRLADGLPCDPTEVLRTRVSPCRGTCFAISATEPTQGLCGSFIDLRTTGGGCVDGAEIEPRSPGDNLGICIFRSCEDNSRCPTGLLCTFPEDGTSVRTDLPSTCAYATARQPSGIPAPGSDGGVSPTDS